MKIQYRQWISSYLASVGRTPVGMCFAACQAMILDFPELQLARGHVDGRHVTYGEDSPRHWWCVAQDGTILDPTATQFLSIRAYNES